MKCTDTYYALQDIKRQEKDELVAAIKAHGGSYSWYDDEKDEWLDDEERGPMVAAYTLSNMCDRPSDITVRSVWLNKNGMLRIDAEESEYGNVVDVQWSDIFVGHISYITEAIPATDNVEDVTTDGLLRAFNVAELHDLQELTVSLYNRISDHSKYDEFQVYEDVRKLLPEFIELHKKQAENPDLDGPITEYYKLVDDFISQKAKELGYD